ncbi:MAG: integration host factor subunit beta [Spirochaetaceae bacterium]|nr:integration host factor subunit beta [Spirochaetaceae bacterium]
MAGKKITKVEVIDSIYEKTGVNRREIKTVVEQVFEVIKGTLIAGGIVEFRGFGTFETRIRKGRRKARNPKTGKEVSVTSHGIAAFRPGRELKQAVWTLLQAEEPDT